MYTSFPRLVRKLARPLLCHIIRPYVHWRTRSRCVQPGPVTIVGLLGSASGLGQGSRYLLQGFQLLGRYPRAVDLCNVFWWHQSHLAPPYHTLEKSEGGTLIIHINPPELPLAIAYLDRCGLRNKKIIGYWAWELETLPTLWHNAFSLVDEIWVPSQFVASAVERETSLPVYTTPYPLPTFYNNKAMPSCKKPLDLCVLCLVDARSSLARKNPFGAIRAFTAAFGTDSRVKLIIKASYLHCFPNIRQLFLEEVNRFPNIEIVEEILSSAAMLKLLQSVDVVISLHRSEGLGLALVEAMRLGKPVIATGWSGNTDFMTRDNSILIGYKLVPVFDPQKIYTDYRSRWAEPDVEEAVEALRLLRHHPTYRHTIGDRAAVDTNSYFGLEHFHSCLSKNELGVQKLMHPETQNLHCNTL